MAVLSEEQTMLRDMAREWADNESPVSAFRKMRDAAPAAFYDAGAWQAQAEMGWAGILIPEAQGGAGMGYVSLGLVLEQLGRTLTATPLAATAAATSALLLGGSEAQQAAWLPRIAAGEVVATLAIDEGPRFAPERIATRVENGRLSGTKAFVAEGDSAQLFVVAATDGLYLVSGDAGVTRSPRRLTDARSHAEIVFDGAPAAKLEGGGPELLTQLTDRAAAALCAEMLGMAEAAFEQTNDYLKTRVQFGQVLASFQALQHRMAKLFTELELMRSVVENALEAIDSGKADVRQDVSLAKAVAGETLHLVSREMIQLHGGIGMTDEHDAGFTLKRARVLEAMWGNAAWHRDRFARLGGY
ncbi:alkylation response protein AidB-like acyl-CoA dehydrogenase [Sphingomonas naasensis]|uniref:Acyl-CoA dehydrogenase n=1 Tax=Sphingomonas naasensis TaxID=1344951 RepID=A0A4S1WLW4_9SPHN|nr:acyl-CoA dehydrogenase family protein [Sphingomonas naasensis]NIJ20115.1 alkylation response protein AidB-like acyl-CoA dehydrogenase [Sphingomonas naasensis]TGX44268.1 acyl-CoA dehydrogenase [Sphingomonas naasensis]